MWDSGQITLTEQFLLTVVLNKYWQEWKFQHIEIKVEEEFSAETNIVKEIENDNDDENSESPVTIANGVFLLLQPKRERRQRRLYVTSESLYQHEDYFSI